MNPHFIGKSGNSQTFAFIMHSCTLSAVGGGALASIASLKKLIYIVIVYMDVNFVKNFDIYPNCNDREKKNFAPIIC